MSVTHERLRAQLLVGRKPRTVEAVVGHLLAVQAQDPRGARLAVRPRSTGLRAADVDDALTDDRSLVLTTLNRGTLHLVRSEDYWWLHALLTPPLSTSNTTRLRQEGVSAAAAEKGVATITRALTRDGPRTRAQLREELQRAGVPVQGQALVHILFLSSLRGLTVRGPMVGTEQAHVLVRDWLGAPPRQDRDSALAELARRYLRGHGPASARDLVKWTGLGLRDARQALAAIAAEVDERAGGLVALRGQAHRPALPPPLLLGAFDPLLHGWVSREPVLGPPGHPATGIVTSNGLFRPFALVGGRAVAVWTMPGRRVRLAPFSPPDPVLEDPAVIKALDAEAVAVERFLAPRD